MNRTITWSLATLFRSGAYNSTFDFNVIQPAFDLTCQYFQLSMPRVRTGGNFRIIQSNVNKNNWAAWTTGNTIYISPTFRFGLDRRRCAKVVVHEFGHFTSGAHSNNPEALMSADGGTSQGWVQDDMRWFGRHKLRGSMPPRGIFATTFGGAMAMGEEDKLPLGVANGIWHRFWDLARPTYQIDFDNPIDL
jgi:hypothetical protein